MSTIERGRNTMVCCQVSSLHLNQVGVRTMASAIDKTDAAIKTVHKQHVFSRHASLHY